MKQSSLILDNISQDIEDELEQAKQTREAEIRRAKEEREARIRRAKETRLLAETIRFKAREATTEAYGVEHDKAHEFQWAKLDELLTKKAVDKAKQAVEEAMWVLNERQVILTQAIQKAEKAAEVSDHAHEEWCAATKARQVAENVEIRTQEQQENAEQEERAALAEDMMSEEQEKEARKREELAESIRKLAELRAQEEAYQQERMEAKQREAEESRRRTVELEEARAKEAAQRAKDERDRRAREEAEKIRELREKEERAEADRKATYLMAAAQERRRCRQRDEATWKRALPWSPAASLERFQLVSTEFDDTKFCATKPIVFENIPWPVLPSPYEMTLEHIEWGEVEAFFAKVEELVSISEYKTLVEKTHRRFHPDKWRSRGLLDTIVDDDVKRQLETAGNIVAQAMTPIWLNSRTRT